MLDVSVGRLRPGLWRWSPGAGLILGVSILVLASRLGEWPWFAVLGVPLVAVAMVRPKAGLYLLAVSLPLGMELNVGTISSAGGERVAYATITSLDLPISLTAYDLVLASTWLGWIFRGLLQKDLSVRLDGVAKLALAFWCVVFGGVLLFGHTLEGNQMRISVIYSIKLLEVFSIYILGRTLLGAEESRMVAVALLSAGLVAAAMGVYANFAGTFQVLGLRIQDRLNFYGYFALVAPLALTFVFQRERLGFLRALCWLLIAAAVAVTVWNGKATIVLGVGAALLCTLVLLRRWLWALALPAGVVALALALPFVRESATRYAAVYGVEAPPNSMPLGAISSPRFAEEAALLRETPLGAVHVDYSTADRAQKLLASLREVPKVWWRGVGFWSAIYRLGFDPHNFFVRLVLETGVVGLLLFLMLLRAVWREARQGIRLLAPPHGRALAVALAAGTVGLVAMSIAGDSFYLFQLMGSYWLVAAAVGAVRAKKQQPL